MGRRRWSPANEAPWLLAASQASASQTWARRGAAARPHLRRHLGNESRGDGPAEHVPPQAGVPGVLEVADAAAHAVPVLHVGALELLVDM